MSAKISVGFRIASDRLVEVDELAKSMDLSRSEFLEEMVLEYLGAEPEKSLVRQLKEVTDRLAALEKFVASFKEMVSCWQTDHKQSPQGHRAIAPSD